MFKTLDNGSNQIIRLSNLKEIMSADIQTCEQPYFKTSKPGSYDV